MSYSQGKQKTDREKYEKRIKDTEKDKDFRNFFRHYASHKYAAEWNTSTPERQLFLTNREITENRIPMPSKKGGKKIRKSRKSRKNKRKTRKSRKSRKMRKSRKN